jgi:hypothetical protein
LLQAILSGVSIFAQLNVGTPFTFLIYNPFISSLHIIRGCKRHKTMADNAMHEDKDASAFFDEVEKEKKNDYETCSASQAFDAVFQCYSK